MKQGQSTDYVTLINTRGDVESIYDLSGSMVARYLYDAWGNTISVKNAQGADITDETHIANVNPMRYRGYYQDAETGLYYLKARYYDAQTHRMMNADSFVNANSDFQSSNLFTYCGNNPVNREDETGNSWKAIGSWIKDKATKTKNAVVNTYNKCKTWVKGVFNGSAVSAGDAALDSVIKKVPDVKYKRDYTDLRTNAGPGRTINSTKYTKNVLKGAKALKTVSKVAGVISTALAALDIAVDISSYKGADMYKAIAMDVGLFAVGLAFGAAATIATGGAAVAVFAAGFAVTTVAGMAVDNEKSKLQRRS